MKKTISEKIPCKDLKIYNNEVLDEILVECDTCMLVIERTFLTIGNQETRKSWYVETIDDFSLPLFEIDLLFLSFNGLNNNIEYSGNAFLKSNYQFLGTGNLNEKR